MTNSGIPMQATLSLWCLVVALQLDEYVCTEGTRLSTVEDTEWKARATYEFSLA